MPVESRNFKISLTFPKLQISKFQIKKWRSVFFLVIWVHVALSHRETGTGKDNRQVVIRLHVRTLISFSHVQLFVTLCTVAHHAPLSVGFSRQEYWNGLLCPFRPKNWTHISCVASRFFTHWATREALWLGYWCTVLSWLLFWSIFNSMSLSDCWGELSIIGTQDSSHSIPFFKNDRNITLKLVLFIYNFIWN